MGYLINCQACGQPHRLDASECKARSPATAEQTRADVEQVDRIERLAIERHNTMRRKPA